MMFSRLGMESSESRSLMRCTIVDVGRKEEVDREQSVTNSMVGDLALASDDGGLPARGTTAP